MTNVYDDPAYTDIVTDLKVKLKEIRKQYKDFPELDQKYIDIYNNMQDQTKIHF